MKLAILGMVAATAGAAQADVTIASHVDDALTIRTITGDHIATTYAEHGRGAYAYLFADAATLWVVRRDASGESVGSIVDGKARPATPIPLSVFKLTKPVDGPAGWPAGQDLGLLTTRNGQVWLQKCLRLSTHDFHDMHMHCDYGFARVDDGSLTYSARRPAQVAFESGVTMTPPLTAMRAAPAGYAIKIDKLKIGPYPYAGFTCTGPGGKRLSSPTADELRVLTTPQPGVRDAPFQDVRFDARPSKATWISATPAIAHLEGTSRTPIGERLTYDSYVVDCTTLVNDVRPLGAGIWLTRTQTGTSELRGPSGAVLASFEGTDLAVAPPR